LMVLLKSWSVSKIQQEFKVSNYVVQTTEKLVAERGIWQSSASCNSWNGEAILCIWWNQQDNARSSACVNLEGIHVQKQLILYSLKEAKYQAF
jgi:hypothetical protein